MKYLVFVFLFSMAACGCERNETINRLLTDQKLLKDSANDTNESIGWFMQRGIYDSAEKRRIQLRAVHARLKDIQSSIDNFSK